MPITRLSFAAIISLTCCSSLTAQTKQKLNIEAATIFLKGAELTSSTSLSLVKGENEIMFTNVAGNVNSSSLVINATNGAVVESAIFQNNYLSEEVLSPKAKEIKDSIELEEQAKSLINTRITVLNEQIAVLQGNRKVSGDNTGLSVAELTKMLELIGSKMEGYLNQKNKQEELRKKIDDHLVRLRQQLDEEQKKGYQPGGQLLVKFYVKEAVTSAITVSYVVPGAGWTPTYDIMADDANGPVRLYYKANVYQNSGVKWNNIRLSLSTGNPVEGAQAPVLSPWYLSFYNPPVYKAEDVATNQAPNMYQAQRGKAVNVSGARSEGTQYIIDGVQVQNVSSMNSYVTVDNSGVNTTFDIELPYTIPSDGKEQLVAIKRHQVPATYRYYAVPKSDKDAFLQARITHWEDLNLLPGQTNIFYEGTYIGQGYLDMRNVKDTMTISLGRDKKIVVKRERDTKRRSVKTIGTNIRETFAYTITVRNTRKEAINLILQDQLPVSNDKDIVVEDKETGDAIYDETTGTIDWALTLAPNESKTVTFGYTIKYPKGKIVTGLR